MGLQKLLSPQGLLSEWRRLVHWYCRWLRGGQMLGDRSKAITISKAEAADLVDLSDFIKPFVDSGEILPRTYDELEYSAGYLLHRPP